MAEDRAAQAQDASGRKLRTDAKIFLGGVISYPVAMADMDDVARAEYSAWEKDAISFLRAEYGEDLVSVVRHEDESYPHLHFYVVPPLVDGKMRIGDVHAGHAAQDAAKADGKIVSEQRQAYRAEMRAYQNRFFSAVSAAHGHARLGPGIRRLSRKEWVHEQAQMAAVAEVQAQARTLRQRLDAAIKSKMAKADVAAAQRVAAAEKKAAEMLSDAKRRAGAILHRARGRASKLGGWISRVVDSMRAAENQAAAKAKAAFRAGAESKEKEMTPLLAAAQGEAENAKVRARAEREKIKLLEESKKELAARVERQAAEIQRLRPSEADIASLRAQPTFRPKSAA